MARKDSPPHFWLMERGYFLLLLSVVCAVLLLAAFVLCFRHYTSLTNDALKKDRQTAAILALLLDEHLQKIVSVMESYTYRTSLRESVEARDVRLTKIHLIDMKEKNPDIDILVVTDREGTLWAAWPERPEIMGENLTYRPWYRDVSREWKPVVSDVVLRIVREKDLAIQISVPFFNARREVTGILVNTQRTVGLNELFKNVSLDPGASVSIADRGGHIVYSSVYGYEKKISLYPFGDEMKRAAAFHRTTFTVIDRSRGNSERFVSFAPLKKTVGWTVFVGRDKRAILLSGALYYRQVAGIALLLFLFITSLLVYSRKQVSIRQIQEQLEVEQEKRADAERYRSFIELSGQIAWTTSPSGELVEETPSWSRYTGRGFDDIKGRGWMDDIHPDDREATARSWEKAVADRIVYKTEYRLRGRDGAYRNYLVRGVPLFTEKGEIREWVGACMDISDRKKAETMIKTRLHLLEFAVHHSLAELLQETLDEVCRLTDSPIGFYHFVEPDQKTISLQAWSTRTLREFCKAGGKGRHYGIEQAGVWADCVRRRRPLIHNDYGSLPNRRGLPEGHAEIIRELVVPVFNEDRMVAIIGIGNRARDYTDADVELVSYFADVAWQITRHKLTDESLRTLSLRQQALLAAIPDIVMEVNRDKVYTWANPAGVDFFGDDVIGKEASFFFEGKQETYRAVQPLFDGAEEVIYLESWQRRRDRRKRLLAWWCRALKDKDGNPAGAISSARDITEQKLAEEEIVRLNAELELRVRTRTLQLESANRELEAFSYSVSHDLRAPLRGIDGFSQALLEDYIEKPLDETGRDYLKRVRRATQRMGLLIDDMLKLSRINKVEIKHEAIDLTAMTREIAKQYQGESPGRVVDLDIQEGVTGEGDPYLMRIAMDNLMNNAFKFTGKTVAPRIAFGAFVKDGKKTCFIRDNGAGFDMAYAGKLFGAFQRLHTLDEFPGTGIGLATVQRIIHRHGGDIWADAEKGRGATFFFTLPGLAIGG